MSSKITLPLLNSKPGARLPLPYKQKNRGGVGVGGGGNHTDWKVSSDFVLTNSLNHWDRFFRGSVKAVPLDFSKTVSKQCRYLCLVSTWEHIHLAKSLAYFSFTVVMLQILQSNCKLLNNDVIYGFGMTAYLNMLVDVFVPIYQI